MNRVDFRPFQSDEKLNRIFLPVVVTRGRKTIKRRLVLFRTPTQPHNYNTTTITTIDIINAINRLLFRPCFHLFTHEQQAAIIDKIKNEPSNEPYLHDIQ